MPADLAQRVPQHRLIAGDQRAIERLLDRLDHAEPRSVGAAQEIDIGIAAPGLDQALAPELRGRRTERVAAAEIVADLRE